MSAAAAQSAPKLDVNRGLETRRAMGKRIKLPNGDALDVGRGSMDANGKITTVPVLDIEVHMYIDEPGTYYDSHGRQLPEQVAAAVGYDVKRNRKLRAALDKRREAMDMIADASVEIVREVVDEKNGFKLIELETACSRSPMRRAWTS